jgi:hypothetical protein
MLRRGSCEGLEGPVYKLSPAHSKCCTISLRTFAARAALQDPRIRILWDVLATIKSTHNMGLLFELPR